MYLRCVNRFTLTLVTFLAALAGLVACSGSDGPTEPGETGGMLVVEVRTSTGSAVEGAVVRIDGRSRTTDAEGFVQIENVAPGTYALDVVREKEAPVSREVEVQAPFPVHVLVTLPRRSGSGGLEIVSEGRTLEWGEPGTLRAVRNGAPAPEDVIWLSTEDTYFGRPVVLGRGAEITTSPLKPGATTVEARLVREGEVVARATVDVSVEYRQAWDVDLESHVPYPDGTVGDVWVRGGHAIVARRRAFGASIVALDGGAREVGRIAPQGLTTQDVKATGDVAYLSNENNRHPDAVMNVDLSDPANPRPIGSVPRSSVPGAHNVWIQGGLLAIASQGSGNIHLQDVSDPTDPRPLAAVSALNATAHDVHVRGDLLFGASLPLGRGQTGEVTIADISDPARPAILSRIHYPDAFSHTVWPSADGSTLYVTDEVVNAPIRIYDISSPTEPRFVGTYQPRLGTVPHNFQVRNDRFAYLAHYKHGVEVVDVSDPLSPRLVGFYDTRPGADEDPGTGISTALAPAHEQSLFAGAWGVHWTADGRIVASDMNRGLFVLRYTGS